MKPHYEITGVNQKAESYEVDSVSEADVPVVSAKVDKPEQAAVQAPTISGSPAPKKSKPAKKGFFASLIAALFGSGEKEKAKPASNKRQGQRRGRGTNNTNDRSGRRNDNRRSSGNRSEQNRNRRRPSNKRDDSRPGNERNRRDDNKGRNTSDKDRKARNRRDQNQEQVKEASAEAQNKAQSKAQDTGDDN